MINTTETLQGYKPNIAPRGRLVHCQIVAKGYKVAICEQPEDPATAKGIVKRDG